MVNMLRISTAWEKYDKSGMFDVITSTVENREEGRKKQPLHLQIKTFTNNQPGREEMKRLRGVKNATQAKQKHLAGKDAI